MLPNLPDVLYPWHRMSCAPETRQRIFDAVRQLNYHADFAARQLRTGKSRCIGVVLPGINQGYLYKLALELEVAFRKNGYSVLYTFFPLDYKDFCAAIDRMTAMNVEAIVTPGYREELPKTSVPLIIWGNDRAGHDCVFPDKTGFGKTVVKLLYEYGHRRIAFAGIMSDSRYRAMEETLKSLQIRAQAEFFNCNVSCENAVEFIRVIAGRKERPTAVVFHSDEMAVSAISEAHRLGIKVPEELSVVGFDNLSMSTSVVPMLTTFDQHFEKMADELVKATLNRLNNPEHPCTKTAVEMKCIMRRSLKNINAS